MPLDQGTSEVDPSVNSSAASFDGSVAPGSKRGLELIEWSRVNTTSSPDYLEFHRRRFEYLVRLCQEILPDRSAKVRVLDIGRSELSRMLETAFGNVETMGFALPADTGGHFSAAKFGGEHHVFNLNQAQDPAEWPSFGKYDLIVMAEVIEHLYTAPELVLSMLHGLMAEGGFLVVQTPNAAAIHKRFKLLFGYNPYERIRPFSGNPGHFREYTKSELVALGETAGLKTVRHEYLDYFGCEGGSGKQLLNTLYGATFAFLPFLRRGQTIVYQAPGRTV